MTLPRVLARISLVVVVACFGMIALGAAPAGGGGGVRAAVTLSAAAAIPPAPLAIPPRPTGPGELIGMVTRPLLTSAGAVSPVTPLGGHTWLLILRHHGRYGSALVPTAGQPRLARIDISSLQLRWTRVRIVVDISHLRLSVTRGSRLLGRFPIAAGTSATPTPTGMFSVTDRVAFSQPGSYGSFALGLSAHQHHLVAGWTGGDQIAIHGTDNPASIGTFASLGCIRVSEIALRVLKRVVPLGAPVVVRL